MSAVEEKPCCATPPEEDVIVINRHSAKVGGAVRCARMDSKGRVLIAERSFAMGDVIYEEPLLHMVVEERSTASFQEVYRLARSCARPEDTSWCWCALSSLTASDVARLNGPGDLQVVSDAVQERLLLLHAPAVEHAGATLAFLANVIASLFCFPSDSGGNLRQAALAEKLLQLWLAWKYNSFEDSDDPPITTAYFLSAFHSHACDPNASWTVSEETWVLRARCSIDAGDEVCISYLSDQDLYQPTLQRRSVLRSSKGFVCMCARCVEPWDVCRGFQCPCGETRYFATVAETGKEGQQGERLASACSNEACHMSAEQLWQLLGREAALVRVCLEHENDSKERRLFLARQHLPFCENALPEHWVAERFWAWLRDGGATKLECREYSRKRLEFMRKVYPGPNMAAAWVMNDVAMWCCVITRAFSRGGPPTTEAIGELKATDAMSLFEEAMHVTKSLNGEGDPIYVRMHGFVEQLRDAASSVGLEL